jgi:membrane protease YdiL (CAAX protease family)
METNMTFVDHLYIFILVVAHPIAGYIGYRRLLRRIAAGEHIERSSLYNVTMIGHWTLFGVALAIWIATERTWTSLGFGFEADFRFLAGIILTAIGIGLLMAQVRQLRQADDGEVRSLREQLGDLIVIIPRNGNELGRFYGLSITAGIVEETLWRGFLIWYLAHVMPLWAAAVLSAIGFGIAHAYQGPANVPRITLVGAAFAGLYLLTGSLWLPMILHAAVDILQGRVAYEVVRKTGDDEAEPSDKGLAAGSAS